MESDLTGIQKDIQYIQLLFQNKQLDEFVNHVEKHILPYLNKQQHLASDHLIQKQKAHLKQQQSKQKQAIKQVEIPVSTVDEKIQNSAQLQKLQEHTKEFNSAQQNKAQAKNVQFAKEEIRKNSQKQNIQQINQTTQPSIKSQQQINRNRAQAIANAMKHSKINIIEKYEEMKLVLFKIQREMKKLETPMTEKGEWKVNKINSTSMIGVKTKGTLIQLRYEGIVQTNIFNLCVMIYLSQLWKQWVPFCNGSKTIAQPSPLEKIVLMDLKIPFLTQRYTYLHGVAADRITKNGKLYIYAEGISHQKDLLIQVHKADKAQYEKKVSKSVVLDAKYMVCEIGNQGNGKYMVKVYGMLDSHMPLLPQKIVNYIVKQLGGMIFQNIIKKAKDIKNTPWQKELKQNEKRQVKNKFYDWLNQRISNWDKTEVARKSKI